MKDTLKYKILKYLFENNNGYPIDVSNLETDKRLLKSKLLELKKEKLIMYGSGTDLSLGNGTDLKIDFIRAKIEDKGIEYLNNVKSKNKNITNNFNNSTIGQFNQDSEFFESPNRIKTKAAPSNNPEIKSSLQKVLSNPYFIGVFLIAIEEITLGNIYKYIISII